MHASAGSIRRKRRRGWAKIQNRNGRRKRTLAKVQRTAGRTRADGRSDAVCGERTDGAAVKKSDTDARTYSRVRERGEQTRGGGHQGRPVCDQIPQPTVPRHGRRPPRPLRLSVAVFARSPARPPSRHKRSGRVTLRTGAASKSPGSGEVMDLKTRPPLPLPPLPYIFRAGRHSRLSPRYLLSSSSSSVVESQRVFIHDFFFLQMAKHARTLYTNVVVATATAAVRA